MQCVRKGSVRWCRGMCRRCVLINGPRHSRSVDTSRRLTRSNFLPLSILPSNPGFFFHSVPCGISWPTESGEGEKNDHGMVVRRSCFIVKLIDTFLEFFRIIRSKTHFIRIIQFYLTFYFILEEYFEVFSVKRVEYLFSRQT